MQSFLRAVGLNSKTSPATPVNETPISDGDLLSGAKLVSTQETLASHFEDALEELRPPALDHRIEEIAEIACSELRKQALSNDPSWKTWSEKKCLSIESTPVSQSNSICGRGIFNWHDAPQDLTLDFVTDVLWAEDTKKKYDDNTEMMAKMITLTDDTHLTCQAFKGRFGFSGRYFHVVISRRRETENDGDESVERLLLGARSIEDEWLDTARQWIDREEVRVEIAKIEHRFVRGFAYVAGIVIEKRTNVKNNNFYWRIMYVNDGDIVTTGVPGWIIDRAKLDQLSIVKNIPKVILEAFQRQKC